MIIIYFCFHPRLSLYTLFDNNHNDIIEYSPSIPSPVPNSAVIETLNLNLDEVARYYSKTLKTSKLIF